MNVLYHFQTRGTGAEAVHIAGIARAFEALGHSVEFSSPRNVDPRVTAGSSPYAGGATVLPPLPYEILQIGYNAYSLLRNLWVIRRLRPDFVYERHAFFLCSTAVLCRALGVPLVVEVNELVGDPRVREQPVFAPLARLADRITFRAARLIVVVSPHLSRRVAALGIPEERILVLPNAVPREEVEAPADGSAARQRLGLAPEAFLVGFVGWFVEWHRFDMLLEAFAAAVGDRPSARLLLVGEGPLEASIREQADRLGIADRLLLPGAVPHDEIPSYVAATDVCVVPHSNAYRSPIKLFEYMAQGRATVAPATEPIVSVVEDRRQVLLFEPGNEDELTKALRALAEDPALRLRLGREARALVLEKHTWTRNAERILSAARLTGS